jgi:hypothetical protein
MGQQKTAAKSGIVKIFGGSALKFSVTIGQTLGLSLLPPRLPRQFINRLLRRDILHKRNHELQAVEIGIQGTAGYGFIQAFTFGFQVKVISGDVDAA